MYVMIVRSNEVRLQSLKYLSSAAEMAPFVADTTFHFRPASRSTYELHQEQTVVVEDLMEFELRMSTPNGRKNWHNFTTEVAPYCRL